MNRYKGKRGGFTLLEVMLVLGILAMLALFVVPRFLDVGKDARIKAARSMVGSSGTIGMALELFQQNLGTYPEELVNLVERPDDLDEEDDRWYPFLKEPNFSDPWGNELVYKFPGEVDENGYDLYSFGPNGEDDDGGEDDITSFKKED